MMAYSLLEITQYVFAGGKLPFYFWAGGGVIDFRDVTYSVRTHPEIAPFQHYRIFQIALVCPFLISLYQYAILSIIHNQRFFSLPFFRRKRKRLNGSKNFVNSFS